VALTPQGQSQRFPRSSGIKTPIQILSNVPFPVKRIVRLNPNMLSYVLLKRKVTSVGFFHDSFNINTYDNV
jgi:hypothetical protein